MITNSSNTVIRDRSFGSDAQIVTKYVVAYSDGLHANGVMSTFKHFPGHGSTEADTHAGYAYTNRSYEELLQAELQPFLAAGENGVYTAVVSGEIPEERINESVRKILISKMKLQED